MTVTKGDYTLFICSDKYCQQHGVSYREFIKHKGKIVAFITKLNNGGFSLCIGKPSDTEVACFTGKDKPFTIDTARTKYFQYIGII